MIQLPMLYMYLRNIASEKQPSPISRAELKAYLGIGLIGCVDTAGRAFSLNALPGSLFVIFASSDLLFNSAFSYYFLGKRFTWCVRGRPVSFLALPAHPHARLSSHLCRWHIAGVLTACGGISVVAADSGDSGSSDCTPEGGCLDDYAPGIIAALISGLANAGKMVLAHGILRSGQKSNVRVQVAEISIFNCFISFLVLWIPLLATGEQSEYGKQLSGEGQSEMMQNLFILVCVGLAVGKMLDRASKYDMVKLKGSLYGSMVDSIKKILTAVVAIFAFGEQWSWSRGVALAAVFTAMGLYSYGSYVKVKAAKAKLRELAAAQAAEEEDIEEGAGVMIADDGQLSLEHGAGGDDQAVLGKGGKDLSGSGPATGTSDGADAKVAALTLHHRHGRHTAPGAGGATPGAASSPGRPGRTPSAAELSLGDGGSYVDDDDALTETSSLLSGQPGKQPHRSTGSLRSRGSSRAGAHSARPGTYGAEEDIIDDEEEASREIAAVLGDSMWYTPRNSVTKGLGSWWGVAAAAPPRPPAAQTGSSTPAAVRAAEAADDAPSLELPNAQSVRHLVPSRRSPAPGQDPVEDAPKEE